MTRYVDIQLGDIFVPTSGRPVFIRDYIDKNPGPFPVFSASLTKPFGNIDSFDYQGHYLTWVMNGYGGRMQEVTGKFSANRDRGVMIPRVGVAPPDLTYVRHAVEPELVANAVGRRVDGKLNEYTKIYPDTAAAISLRLPITSSGQFDYERMAEIGAKIRKIEAAQAAVRASRQPLADAAFVLEVSEPFTSISLSDTRSFALCIGARVLRNELAPEGVPAYSANALTPFGYVKKSNLQDFSRPSLLWGIDGNFDWNYIDCGTEFATTDHCGRLQILTDRLVPEYVYWYLKVTRARYGFDRVYRASLTNIKADASLQVPLDKMGEFCLARQRRLAEIFRQQQLTRAAALESLDRVLQARISIEL